jgi:death-on-curing protein
LLTADDVVAIYADTLGYSEVGARDLLRSAGGLEGAIGRLQAHIDYRDADLATLAAVLLHGLAEGQHFIDGNKRVAAAAMLGFLALNGCALATADGVLADWVLRLSSGLAVAELADEIRPALTSLEE